MYALGRQKVQAALEKVKAANAALFAAKLNRDRVRKLSKAQVESRRASELAELAYAKQQAALNLVQAERLGAQANEIAMRAERLKMEADAQTKVQSAQAEYKKARAKEAYTKGDLIKFDVKVARQASQVIRIFVCKWP